MPVSTRKQTLKSNSDTISSFRINEFKYSPSQDTPNSSATISPKKRRLISEADRERHTEDSFALSANCSSVTSLKKGKALLALSEVDIDKHFCTESDVGQKIVPHTETDVVLIADKVATATKIKRPKNQVTVEAIEECASKCTVPQNFYDVWNGKSLMAI